jgi:hypothetical protein
LIELKYIPRSEEITSDLVSMRCEEAKKQLKIYMKDEKIKKKFAVRKEGMLKAIYLLWHGWELIETGEIRCTHH